MMPEEGRYTLVRVARQLFLNNIVMAHDAGKLVSRIGYEQNAQILQRLTGVPIPVNRDRTEVQDGDVLLCMTLKYRAGNDHKKGEPVGENDFEWWIAYYHPLKK